MRTPSATYRLQLKGCGGFAGARALVPYLRALGITDLYASPILRARAGSSHGYDVTDPSHLDPELGSEEDFAALSNELSAYGMGLLVDIVPNHMAASEENPWWRDVLEHGPSSPYAPCFDIAWRPAWSTRHDRVLLPILGSPYGQALENAEIAVALDEGGFHVRYGEARLPVDPRTYPAILGLRPSALKRRLGSDHPTFHAHAELILAFRCLPSRTAARPELRAERRRRAAAAKARLRQLCDTHEEIRSFLEESVRILNGRRGEPQSFRRLDELLSAQAYRLAYWRAARAEVNYRRFFAISELVGVRVEDPQVFEATHALILRLLRERKITGLRIDHIDGVRDPADYLRLLRRHLAAAGDGAGAEASPPFYVIVEKILAADEELPEEWPVSGTTGYDFLRTVSSLSVDSHGLQALDRLYGRLTGSTPRFDEIAYQQKKLVLDTLFAGEMRALEEELIRLAGHDRYARDLPAHQLARALAEVSVSLPVYRTYIRDRDVAPRDRRSIDRAIGEARRRTRAVGAPAFDFLRRVLRLELPARASREQEEAWQGFVLRWQQLTGPIMAKGVEDTALYMYNRLISLNEVGGEPGASGLGIDEFHRRNLARQARWPATLNSTSTHDTKRSEDVRARIHILSEIPRSWAAHLKRWREWNRAHLRQAGGKTAPDANEELLIYQTLIGAWPLEEAELPGFRDRLRAYLLKAIREAKVHTDWLYPDEAYEAAVLEFADRILESTATNRFLEDFLRFQQNVAYYGALNSLSQLVLKIASPGIPDFYQGTELWDFSLVDPDNRRPVDFERRACLLGGLAQRESAGVASLMRELLESWKDGRIKLYVTARALGFRREHSRLFSEGCYLPLDLSGRRKEQLCAFARRRGEEWAVIAVPQRVTRLAPAGEPPLGRRAWGSTRLHLPQEAPDRWSHVLTGELLAAGTGSGRKALALGEVFQTAPLAILYSAP